MHIANSTAVGDEFENRVLNEMRMLIASGSMGFRPESARLFPKKGYWSRDREGDIVFDIALEIWPPDADRPSIVVLVECKDLSRRVGVDDIEEFEKKREQVNPNAKGIVFSTTGFTQGALTFAKNRGLGLALFPPRQSVKWELRRELIRQDEVSTSDARDAILNGVPAASRSPYYFFSSAGFTASPWHFTRDFFGVGAIPPRDRRLIWNSKSSRVAAAPFITKKAIEEIAGYVLSITGNEGEVPNLDAVVARAKSKSGLVVDRDARIPEGELPGVLGRMTFDPPRIQVFKQEHVNREQANFTLAHELGHYTLDHQRYLVSEYVDAGDADRFGRFTCSASSLDRLEFQANHFAACLLMPRALMARYYWYVTTQVLRMRKARWLYVDEQPCNRQALDAVLRFISGRLVVSRQAARNRLTELNLLYEA